MCPWVLECCSPGAEPLTQRSSRVILHTRTALQIESVRNKWRLSINSFTNFSIAPALPGLLPCLSLRDFMGIIVEIYHYSAVFCYFRRLSTNLDRKTETVVSVALLHLQNLRHKTPAASVGLQHRSNEDMDTDLKSSDVAWVYGKLLCHCGTVLMLRRKSFKAITRVLSKKSRLIL